MKRCACCHQPIEWKRGPDGLRAFDLVPVVVAQDDHGTTTAQVRHVTTCRVLATLPAWQPRSYVLAPAAPPTGPTEPPPPGRSVAMARRFVGVREP